MDINKMLAELREEREQITQAILTLERLAGGRGHRRGRPPLWMKKLADCQLNIRQQPSFNRVGHTRDRTVCEDLQGGEEQTAHLVDSGSHTIESSTGGNLDL